MKKKFVITGIVLVLILALVGVGFFTGVLVKPFPQRMNTYSEVKSYDILAFQNQREQDILQDYRAGHYTLQAPYILQDPYQANPLSAMVIFETDQPAQATVTVFGKDDYSTFHYTYPENATHHEIAVLGLYPGVENKVQISIHREGAADETADVPLKTEALPFDFPKLDIQVSKPAEMEPGVNLMIPCFETNYTYLLDANGAVRGYFTNKNFGHGTAMRILQNGRLIATGDVMKIMPYNMYTLWEMNLLGKVFVEYEIPNAVHHDVIELANGNFLAASNNANMPAKYDTREDVIIQVDRQSGLVVQQYDLRKILDDSRKPYNHFDPGIINQPNHDWAHTNSVEVDPSDGSIIASSPIQSTVVKFDPTSGAIRWILSSPEGWDGQYSRFQRYLLKPTGSSDFEWQWAQHGVKVLPDTDHNPDTIDLLLMDNGQARSFDQATSILPENNYSRAVIFRIDQVKMTVEQLWRYGKERGSEAYSTFLGNADLLPKTGNINISFGGMMRKDNGTPVDEIVQGVLGQVQVQSRVVEVQKSGNVVFDVSVTPNHTTTAETFQTRRIDLYTDGIQYKLGELPGQRKGEIQSAELITQAVPKFIINTLDLNFTQLFVSNGYLMAQGNFLYQGKAYMLGRINLVLMSQARDYVFQGNPGLNGNFYSRIDLQKLQPGEYAVYALGGVVDGMDAKGKIKAGFNPTGYKVLVK